MTRVLMIMYHLILQSSSVVVTYTLCSEVYTLTGTMNHGPGHYHLNFNDTHSVLSVSIVGLILRCCIANQDKHV